jgi:hypothetical protein
MLSHAGIPFKRERAEGHRASCQYSEHRKRSAGYTSGLRSLLESGCLLRDLDGGAIREVAGIPEHRKG